MSSTITPDTRLCVSLSARPSNFGTRFHNFLYRALDLDFVYKAFAVSDIDGAIRGVRALGIRSAAVSMPFKQEVMRHLDHIDPVAREIGAVNTVLNQEGVLTGFNTDFLAVKLLLESRGLKPEMRVALLGSGGMARAIATALKQAGFRDVTIVARNARSGKALAEERGFAWIEAIDGRFFDFLINATPIGMMGDAQEVLAFPSASVENAIAVMDSVANPSETPLIRAAQAKGKTIVTGFEIIVEQACEQFRLATGRNPSRDQIRSAAEFARS